MTRIATSLLVATSALALVALGVSGVDAATSAVSSAGHSMSDVDSSSNLGKAASIIEKSDGGKVMEIRPSNANGGGYDAVVSANGQVSATHIDSNGTMSVLAAANWPAWADHFRGDSYRTYAFQNMNVNVDIGKAIATAENFTPGKPVEADFTAAGSIRAYDVEVLTPRGDSKRVFVDARNGIVIRNPGGLPS